MFSLRWNFVWICCSMQGLPILVGSLPYYKLHVKGYCSLYVKHVIYKDRMCILIYLQE